MYIVWENTIYKIEITNRGVEKKGFIYNTVRLECNNKSQEAPEAGVR